MATKRHTPDRAFSEAEKMFLLGGFDALPEALDDLPEPEGMRIFGWFVGDAAAVFDRHREYLYAEAKRLGDPSRVPARQRAGLLLRGTDAAGREPPCDGPIAGRGRVMATKRLPDSPDLSNDVIAILLAGWGSEPPPGLPRVHGFAGGSLELSVTGGLGPGGLWRAYAPWLRERAREWGWTPHYIGPDGERRFFGEAAAWEADRGERHVRGALSRHADDRDDDNGNDDDGSENEFA